MVAQLTDPIDPAVARSLVADTSTDALAPELVDLLVEEVLKVPIAAWRELFGSLADYDDLPELSRLTAPVRLIWGDDDEIVPRAMQDELVARLHQAELLVYQGAGQHPSLGSSPNGSPPTWRTSRWAVRDSNP